MADDFDDILTTARNAEGRFDVTIVTNQDTGVATFGSATLKYSETQVPGYKGLKFVWQHLSTEVPMQLQFSEPDAFRASASPEHISLDLRRRAGGTGPIIAEVTFPDFGNLHFTILLNEMSKCWVGMGPRFDLVDRADAVWVVSFQPTTGTH
jgi:hypothetical protein